MKSETNRQQQGSDKSHPARGAWIEIRRQYTDADGEARVAPRKGCVD